MAAYIVLFSGAFIAATMEDHSFFRRRVCHLDLVRVCRLRNTSLWIFWEMTSGACRHLLGSTVDTEFASVYEGWEIFPYFLREGGLGLAVGGCRVDLTAQPVDFMPTPPGTQYGFT